MTFDALRNLPALGISSALSCRSVHARVIRLSHGWRRFGTSLLVDRGTTPLVHEFTTGGVMPESLRVGRHESSNHRVEMNRHRVQVKKATNF